MLSPDLAEQLKTLDPQATPSSYALRWVGSHPHVQVILSGMSTMEQVDDNLRTFENFQALSQQEYEMLEQICKPMRARVGNACTGCKYCMPCPAGVDIPMCFKMWNQYRMFQNYNAIKISWERMMKPESKPDACQACGKCEPLCPQRISIQEDLKKMLVEFSAPKYL